MEWVEVVAEVVAWVLIGFGVMIWIFTMLEDYFGG